MLDNLEEISFQIDEETIRELEKDKRARFLSYGTILDFFAVLEISGEKAYYRKGERGVYHLLPKAEDIPK